MSNIAQTTAARPSAAQSPPAPPSSKTEKKAEAPPRSWVFARRVDGDSPVEASGTIGTEIRRQASWLGLVLQQKIQRYGEEIGGSVDYEEVITRLLDVSLEADAIESDFKRLSLAEDARLARKAAKSTPHRMTKAVSKVKDAPPASSKPSSGMKPRAAWQSAIRADDLESIGEAMRRQVSTLAAAYRQRVREDGLGSEDWDIESSFARLMALSLEVEDAEGSARAWHKEQHAKRVAANAGPDPIAPTNPTPAASDELAERVFAAFRWPQLLTTAQLGLARRAVREAASNGLTFHGLHALLFTIVQGLEDLGMLPSEPADETLGKAMRRHLGTVTSAVTLQWGKEEGMKAILGAASVLMKLSRVADEIDGVDEEEAPPTSAGSPIVNDAETAARIAARQASEKADLDEVRGEYNEITDELESLNPSDDVALSSLLLGAVGHYPSAPLCSLLEEIKVRTSTLSHLTGYAVRGQFSGTDFDKEGSLESIASEMTSLAHKAETAFELMKRLGLGWKVA